MKFLKDRPALILEELDKRTLVLADLHLGLEYEVYRKGISIPPRVENQKKRIKNIINETNAERLYILGDVKHNVPNTSVSEKEKLPDFFKELCKKVEVKVAKGNHDGNIEDLSEGSCAEIMPTDGFKKGKFYFNHGQSWPSKEVGDSKILVRGHSHPAVEFSDDLGFSSTVPCWVRGPVVREKLEERFGKEAKLEEILIVPAFNKLISGIPMNRKEKERLLGPILENGIMNTDEAEISLLDGTFVGRLENL